MTFNEARQAVADLLNRQFLTEPENPTVHPYGFDTGTHWVPLIHWDGVMGTFAYLVDKNTRKLTPVSFAEFDGGRRVGDWPKALA